jgi:hypothetical protein
MFQSQGGNESQMPEGRVRSPSSLSGEGVASCQRQHQLVKGATSPPLSDTVQPSLESSCSINFEESEPPNNTLNPAKPDSEPKTFSNIKKNDPLFQFAQGAIFGGATVLGIGLIVSTPLVPLVIGIGVGFVVGGVVAMKIEATRASKPSCNPTATKDCSGGGEKENSR